MQSLASPATSPRASKALRISLWIAQALMFTAFLMFGLQKLFMPPESLAVMWQSQWPIEHPTLLRVTGVIDVAGGLGILLPTLARIQPRLAVLAALGCTLLQIAAIVFHAARGEFSGLPLNLVLLAFVGFIFWGRSKWILVPPLG